MTLEILRSEEISVASISQLRRCLALGHHHDSFSINIRWPGTNLWRVSLHHKELMEANPLSPEKIMELVARILASEESVGLQTSLRPLRDFAEDLDTEKGQKALTKVLEPLSRQIEKELVKSRTRVQVGLYADLHIITSSLDQLRDEREGYV